MSVTRYEVEIDLSQVEQAKLQDNKQYFHQDIYASLLSQVTIQMVKSDLVKTDNQRDDINQTRSHDAILLNGARGCGKTSILVNFSNYMKKDLATGNAHAKILFLNPVDPTLLNEKEDFLNIVLGQINANEEVCKARDNARHDHADVYEKTLEQLAEALEGEQTLKERYGLDRMLSYQGGLEITKHTHAFFREVLRLTGKSLIVLPIDDVDMSLEHGFKVLEVVRKYLCSPHFLPIVSGDLALYRELVVNSFSRALVESSRDQASQRTLRAQADDLATEYLRKVFPIHNRHTVPAIDGYLQGRAADGRILAANVRRHANNELIDLASLGHLVHAALNGRVNGEEQSAVEVNIPTARQLIQFLKSLEEVLCQMLARARQQNKPVPLPFQTRVQAVDWWQGQDKATAAGFYLALAKYFTHTQDLRLQYLCMDLARLNQSADQGAIELGKLTYLSLTRQIQLSLGEKFERQNETYALFAPDEISDWTASQFERLPLALQKQNIYTMTALPAIEPIDRKLKFKREWKATTRQEQFLHDLLTHSDFYTSYQTAPLVFFGKFFELITTTLMRDIDGKWLQNLLSRPPYHSIFDTSGTKTFEFDDDEPSSDADDVSTQETNMLLTRAGLDELAELINRFRSEEGLDTIAFIDIAIIHSLQSKFFNQINLFKKAGYVSTGKKGIRRDVPEVQLLPALASRAMYTYWTALGSFELGELYFSTPPKIAHHNFASANQIALGNLHSKPAYTLNVKPFLDLESLPEGAHAPLTKLLARHPVFKVIDTYEEFIADAVRASVAAASELAENPEVQGQLPVPDSSMRRPKYYNALSAITRTHFSTAAFDRCMKADRESRLQVITTAVKYFLSQLDGFALIACQTDQTEAANLLKRLGSYIKDKQFFGQNKALDQLLLVIFIAASVENVNIADRPEMIELMQRLGASKLTAAKIGRGI